MTGGGNGANDEGKAVSTREIAGRYQKARKKEKGVVLDDLVILTGYTRCQLPNIG